MRSDFNLSIDGSEPEILQDNLSIVVHDRREAAKDLREARKEADDKGKLDWREQADLTVNRVRLVADAYRPGLIVAGFFPELQKAVKEA